MRLLAITDLHGNEAALERILADAGPVEIVFLGGDLTTFGSPDDAERLIAAARHAASRHAAPRVLAVAGNCDSAEIQQRLAQLGVSLHACGLVLGEIGLHGLSAIPPWKRRMYQLTEEELEAALRAGHLQLAGARVHCILAHAPPYGLSLDQVSFGRHAGSKALRTFIEETRPSLAVCGHVHESRGVEKLGPTTVVNCGYAARGYYAVIDVDDEAAVQLRRA